MDASTAAAQLESFNPATGERIGAVPTTAPDDVQAVVDDVAEVQPFWAQLTLADRARYLERAAQVLIDEADEIRDLLVREQGKPRTEAFSMEVLPTIDALHWIARAGTEILADEKIPMPQLFLKTKRSAFTYEPLGVIGVISPWNYPWSIPFGEVAMALMAGNGVVLKPASLTPLIGERIRKVFERAGVPEGLVRVVHGPGTGPALVESSVGEGVLHRLGRDRPRGRRGVRAPAEGLGARARRQGPDDRAAGRQPRPRGRRRALGRVRERRADVLGDRARVRAARGRRAVHRGRRCGRPAAARRRSAQWDTEIGPMVSREQFEIVPSWSTTPSRPAPTLRCGGPVECARRARAGRSTPRPC